MPRYLALDYAYEAIKEHQNFLSVFLLALPSSLKFHGHAGSNDDYSYKLPWLQVKGTGTLRSLSNCEGIKETLREIVPSASEQGLERISEEAIYLPPSEDDIVPSSNPDSPPLDSQIKRSIQSGLQHTYLCQPPGSIEGHCVEEEEGNFDVHGTGREYARFMLENLFDVISESRQHQTCKEMCKQLVPKTIKDPFASLPPELRTEELQLGADEQEGISTKPYTELSKDLKMFPDVWKDQANCKENELLLPELVSSAHTVQCAHPIVCEVMPDHCLRLEQDSYTDKFDWSERGFLQSASSHTVGLHQEPLPCTDQSDGDPVKLNCEGLGLLDHKEKFGDLEQGSLEPPRTPIDVSKSAKDPGLDPVKVPLTPISCFDAEIVTPKAKEKAENRMWKTEQCLHEAVALSLKVPEMQNNEKPNPVPSPKSQLGLTKEHGNSDVDLLVPWQPVNISRLMENKKFTRSVEDIEGAGKIKMLDSAVGSNLEPVRKEELSIGGDEYDKILEPLGMELERTFQKATALDSVCQRENSEEHSSTPSEMPMTKTEKPLHEGSKEKTADVAPKRHIPVGDPLMDFLKLRCKETLIRKERGVPIQQPPLPPPLLPVADKKDAGELPTIEENDSRKPSKPITIKKEVICKDDFDESKLTPTKSGNKKSKSRVVEVTLTAPFLEMIKVIEEALAPVVSHLHSISALSPSYTLDTLTTDVTRFLLLQHEKQGGSSTEKEDTERHKYIILLHSYATAIDLMINCDAVSAIMHLALTNERYKDILKGCLDSVRNVLFKKQCLLPKHTLHPKLQEMARLTAEWFQKKLKKEGRDHDPKVLVIIRREYTKLAENVTSVLLSVKGLSASTLSSTPNTTYMAVSEALDKHNCLVISPAQIDESFPWAHFSLVIEYEASPKSPWKELCLRQKIRHIELRCVGHATSRANLGHLSTTDGVNEKKADDKPKQIPLKLIGSDSVINSSKLLHMLETRFNILIVERTTASTHNSPLPRTVYADLILDERRGIIIVELESFLGEGAVEPLVHRITMLSQQFCKLWVILEGNGHSDRYALGGHVVVNTCKLQAALSQFTAKSHDFEVRVMYSNDSICTASTINVICDISRKASEAVWHNDDWLTRPWLTDRLSKHERFLTGFSCVNSFSAQVMLTAAPLPVLLSAPLAYLTKLCPWIPTRITANFHKLVHDESPFCDRPSKVHVTQKREEPRSNQAESIPRDRSVIGRGGREAIADEGATIGNKDAYDMGSSNLYHQQHGRRNNWSMLQSERENIGQGELRQLRQDLPVTIKSEQVGDSPVYDLDGEELYHLERCIPDDLKTPLELLASSDSIRKNQPGLSRYDSEEFDADDTTNVDHHTTRDLLLQFDKDRSGQRDLSDLLSYSSTAKPGNATVLAREWTMEEAMQPSQHSSIRASARQDYSGIDALLPSQHQDLRCQEWDVEQRLTNKEVKSDYSKKEQIRFSGQSASVPAQRTNTRTHGIDQIPCTHRGAPRKYIGIAQPCPRAATGNPLQMTIPKGSLSNKMSRRGEFGTLATSGLPARRGPASSQNQNQGYFPGQRHPQYPSQQEQHRQRPPDHHQSQGQETLHSRDDHWGGGRDAVILSRPGWLQGKASSYQHQRGDAFLDTGKPSCIGDIFTDGPTKRRRLTYERVPGSKGGQTKLTFR